MNFTIYNPIKIISLRKRSYLQFGLILPEK